MWSATLALAVLLFAAALLRWELEPRIQGEEGEMDVDDELFRLPSDYRALGSLSIVGRSNIDNVVVGPTGIWALEVKSHRRLLHFGIGGFVRQAWAEAYAVRDALRSALAKEYVVQPVVVFSNPRTKVRFGLNKQQGVFIIGIQWLRKLILEQSSGQRLAPDEIARIAEVLRRYKE